MIVLWYVLICPLIVCNDAQLYSLEGVRKCFRANFNAFTPNVNDFVKGTEESNYILFERVFYERILLPKRVIF